MFFRRHLVSTSAVLALGLSAQALAQGSTAVTTGGKGIEEVVVTARKRNERLQKVPVAVTAFGTAQLAQNKVVSINDLSGIVPSLTFQQSSYSTFATLIGIRGQKTGDTILSETPSIGIYVDDVYAPSTIGTGIGNLYDTRSIEVLKGPQGTLYGRNTTGGAVKISSNLPDYKGFYGSATLGFGNYNSNHAAVMINAPIIKDELAVRVVIERDYHGGFAYDHTNNRAVDFADARSGRIAVRYDPLSNLEVVLRANASDGRSGGVIANLEEVKPVFSPGGAPTFSPTLLNVGLETGSLTFGELLPFLAPAQFGPPTAADFGAVLAGQQAAYNDLQKYLRQGYNVNYSEPQSGRVKNDGVSLNATYRLNEDLSLKNITSYQYAASDSTDDTDGTPFRILEGPADVINLDQLTEELQLSGKGLGDKLVYTAGLYYYYLTGNDDSPGEQELPFLNFTGSPVNTRDHLFDTSKSVYGQATYAFLPNVHLTSGVRWTQEDTELAAHSTAGPGNACNLPPPAGTGSVACAADFKNSFHNFSYTAGLDWEVTDSIMLYVKTSRGFKAGGQNQRGSTDGGFDAFAPEQVTDYEIGTKADFLQHRLRFDVAAYHSDYTDIQRSVLFETPNNQTITEIKNAASATIDGVEAEITARPIPPLILQANAAYTSAHYQSYFSEGLNLSGNAFQDQPLWQFNLAATYTHDVNIASLPAIFTGTVNFSYQSKVSLGPDDLSYYSHNYTDQPGYGLLNARTALEIPRYGVTLDWWAKNLTNRKYLTGMTDVTNSLGLGLGYLSDPMTFGFDITKTF